MARHSAHDDLVAEVASWYREPTPEMGYDVVEGRFGWFHPPSSTGRGRGTIRPGTAGRDLEALLAEAEEIIATESMELACDERATAAELGPLLEARSFEPSTATVFLAYVGKPRDIDADLPAGLTVEEIARDNDAALTDWVVTKIQAFDDSDDQPADERVDEDLAIRRAEMSGQARALAGRIDGETAAICGFYEATDRFVFLLGTRVPFRHRRIGRALLHHVVDGATARGSRSVIINGDEGGAPVALYRQLGFTDEVQWRRSWNRPTRPRTFNP